MDPLSETESEQEQYPTEPVVEPPALEKPKRKYTKKVKVVEPEAEPVDKPKRVMSEKQLANLAAARERRAAERAAAKAEAKEEPKEEPVKRGRPKKVETPKENVVIKEIHHHYAEPKKPLKKEPKKEKAPKKEKTPKEEPKQVINVPLFV